MDFSLLEIVFIMSHESLQTIYQLLELMRNIASSPLPQGLSEARRGLILFILLNWSDTSIWRFTHDTSEPRDTFLLWRKQDADQTYSIYVNFFADGHLLNAFKRVEYVDSFNCIKLWTRLLLLKNMTSQKERSDE